MKGIFKNIVSLSVIILMVVNTNSGVLMNVNFGLYERYEEDLIPLRGSYSRFNREPNLFEFSPSLSINLSSEQEITNSVTYNDTTVYIYEDINVINGGLLEFYNCTVYLMGNNSKLFQVSSSSNLIFNDTAVRPHNNFSETRWAIIIQDSSSLTISNSQLESLGVSQTNNEQQGIFVQKSRVSVFNSSIADSYTLFTLDDIQFFSINTTTITNVDNVFVISNSANIRIGPKINIGQISGLAYQIVSSVNVMIKENSVLAPSSGTVGIVARDIVQLVVFNNTFYSGFQIINSSKVSLSKNTLLDPNAGQERDYGILLIGTNHSEIYNNDIRGLVGLGGFSYAVSIQGGMNISLVNNVITNFRGWGIEIVDPVDIYIFGNQITRGATPAFYDENFREIGGGVGLYLSASTGEELIRNNTFKNLPFSVYFNNQSEKLDDYSNTVFYLNNWESINNTIDQNLVPTIFWYSSIHKVGNYWANFTGVDANNDSIIDEAYYLSSTVSDQYPLFYPNYVPEIDYSLSHTWFLANGVNQTITWIVTDDDPQNYNVTENSVLVQNGRLYILSVNDTRVVNTSISTTEGNYTYEFKVIDLWGNYRKLSVEIEVEPPDYNAPVLYLPDNITLVEYEPKKVFTWNCTELHPEKYTITLDDTFRDDELTKGEWNTTHLTVEIGNLAEKILQAPYTLNITLWDVLDNRSSYEIPVYVYDKGAVIVGEDEINGSQDSIVDIFWDIYDSPSDGPIVFDVYRNGTLMPSNQSSIVNVYFKDLLIIGIRVRHRFDTNSSTIGLYTYNYTIQVQNAELNRSTTLVHVRDTIPPLISPSSTNPTVIDEETSEPQVFQWIASDTNPFRYNMTIYSFENESTIIVIAEEDLGKNNTWRGGNLTYTLKPLEYGIGNYRFDVSVTDIANNTAYSPGGTFRIIDNTSIEGPFNPPENMTLEYSSIEEHTIKWNFTDRNPRTYQLYRNTTLISTGEWNGSILEFNVSDILWTDTTPLENRLGYYIVSIFVFDAGNHQANDSVGILVQDTIAPLILNPPENETTVIQVTNFDVFNFSINESMPDQYYLAINSILVRQDPYNQSIIMEYNLFSIGKSYVNLTLTDLANNTSQYIFNVTLVDNAPPLFFNHEKNRTMVYPETRIAVSWKIFDVRPYIYLLYVNDTLIISNQWNERIYLVLDFGIGVSSVRLEVYDTSNNSYTERFTITVLDTTAPIIHYLDPTSVLTIEEEDYVDITIIAEDVAPDYYDVYINEDFLFRNVWTEDISFRLENFTVGEHMISITLYDTSRNNVTLKVSVKVISTSIITVPETTRILGMDKKSFSGLVGLVFITLLITSIKRIKKLRRRSND